LITDGIYFLIVWHFGQQTQVCIFHIHHPVVIFSLEKNMSLFKKNQQNAHKFENCFLWKIKCLVLGLRVLFAWVVDWDWFACHKSRLGYIAILHQIGLLGSFAQCKFPKSSSPNWQVRPIPRFAQCKPDFIII